LFRWSPEVSYCVLQLLLTLLPQFLEFNCLLLAKLPSASHFLEVFGSFLHLMNFSRYSYIFNLI